MIKFHRWRPLKSGLQPGSPVREQKPEAPMESCRLSSQPSLHYRGRRVEQQRYDGVTDDLATAGLGAEGLQSATPPPFADPKKPTAQELRRRAIYENYRGLTDTSAGGGYGRFFGPGVPTAPEQPAPPEKIPGEEYRVYGDGNVTMLLQVPDSFDPKSPSLLLVPSSASRGVYGGIAVGEWGLKNGFAVVYTDKGTGTGFHNLDQDRVILKDGTQTDSAGADGQATFVAPDAAAARSLGPHRYAAKHAHSGQHVEAKWGEHVLESARFAFSVLNEVFGDIRPQNTHVIASGVSNGGGASLRAAELDREELIDAVAVSEPNITPVFDPGFVIRQGQGEPLLNHSQTLLEYASFSNLYQSAAGLAPENAGAPLNAGASPERAAALKRAGLLKSQTLEEQGREAQLRLREAGFLPEQDLIAPSHATLEVPLAMALNTANAYGRFLVSDQLAGYSLAAVDDEGRPTALDEEGQASLYARSNGICPTGGISIINDRTEGGPIESKRSFAQNLEGALELRALATGVEPTTGQALEGELAEQSERIRSGMEEIKAGGDLQGKPAVIVNGRCDAVLSPNHASRSYTGKSLLTEGDRSRLSYVEVTTAQHLDVLNGLPAFAKDYVPLAPYLLQALNAVNEHLLTGQPLPPSQVVHSGRRGEQDGAVPPLEAEHIPPIQDQPGAGAITLVDGELRIPD